MAFSKKTWVDRAVEFAGRRLLIAVSGLANGFDVSRSEGTVFVPGDEIDATNLNDLETRIATEFNLLNLSVTALKGTTVYTNASPTLVFTAKTVTLSESAANFTKAEVIFKVNNGLTEYSTTGVLDIALIKMLRAPFFIENARSVSISETSAVFGSGYTYNTYSNGTQTQADGYCVPYKIIFYK